MKSLAVRPCRASFDRSLHWGVLKLVAGLLALVALLTACAQTTAALGSKVSATPAAIPTFASMPTITPLPSAPLLWRHATLPTNASGAAVAVAPSAGATVYACAAPHPTGSQIEWPRVWVTHDYTAHWSQMASIPADHVNNGCVITVDQLNPAIVVAVLIWMPNGAGGGPSINDMTNYVTFNGGASWRKLTDPQPFQMSFLTGTATRNGTTFAIRSVVGGETVHTGLWVSSDHMTTWRLIDPPTGGIDAVTFWLQPTTGELLALYGEFQGQSSLWDSPDGGAHWTQIDAPTRMTPGALQRPYLTEPFGDQPGWTICSTDVEVAGNPLTCSVDSGKTWDTRPVLVPSQTGVSGVSGAQQSAFAFGLASDGTVLATLSTGSTSVVYRLSPGAEQWQSRGDLPSGMSYASLAGGTVIWSTPGSPVSPIIATTHG